MNLTEAYERLAQYVESLPPSVREPLEMVLDANCVTCSAWVKNADWPSPNGDCVEYGISPPAIHGCRAWEKREETA